MERIVTKDVNGRNVIRVPFVIATIIITILLSSIPVVYSYGVLNQEVKTIKEAIPVHEEDIRDLEDRVRLLENIASTTDLSLGNIEEDVADIKTDLKDFIKEMRSMK